jgi:alkylation response protein AidB-like acyl-CoA dehydrogenase
MACDLNLSEDQRQILASAGAMLEASYPVSRRRERKPDNLGELAAFGLFGIALPQDGGEPGYSVVEEALLHVLLGRHVVSAGALAASLAARLASGAGRSDIADGIVAGTTGVCAAIASRGSALLVERGDASLALLFDGRRLTLLDIGGVATQPVESLGHGIPLQRIGKVREIARSGDDGLADNADLLISAQLLGVAEAARDLTVAYANMRQQFGQPIGGFQAIKHHCADMAVAAEMASAQLDMAAIALRDGRADAPFQVAALRHLAEKAAIFNTRTAVQVHGGIGFSAEADVHHYLKQAHLLSRLGAGADLLAMPAPLAPHAAMNRGD